jgi:nitrogen fixation protein
MAVNINIPSQVSQTITDGVTDKAPSEDAVHDALALKANTADLGATAFSNDYNDLDNLPTIPSLTGYVPYTGATNDVDLGTYNITADHINLNVSPSGAGFVVGSTQWNNTIGSSETLLKGGNVTLKNGVDLVARIVNKVVPNTTLTKAAYQAVRVSGAQGGRLAVALAQANNDNNSADTIGLVTETIATNQEGFIITVGQLENIDTTGNLQGETWTDGDVLYLSPTVAGKLTNIKPTGATGHIVVIGYVEYAHANNGKIYVKVMNGWELDELHNVYITNPTGGASLEYQASTQLWIDAGIQYTVELIDALTVNFYAPYNMVITSVSNVLNSPTITIQDDNVAYTLGNTIAIGSKITVTASTASVVNLTITK